MRRMAILGCSLLLVAGCGGGGSSDVEEMMQLVPSEPETGPMETEPGSMEPKTSPTLSTLGAYQSAPIDDVGDAFTAVFHRWGVWGGILRDDAVTCTAIGCPPAGDTIFMAYINHEMDGTVSTMTQGTRSGTSPAMGSAVWTGDVKAYETEDIVNFEGTSVTTYSPVEGDARIEVDFTAISVDVDFTNFDNSRADMSWDGLAMEHGAFGDETAGIEGSFYGADHEGAAGTFARGGLTGVFGALRSSD